MLTTVGAVGFRPARRAALRALQQYPYASLVIFVALPALFMFGLLLIPFGMWFEHRRLLRDPNAAREWFVIDFRSRRRAARADVSR